ncbi:MAG: hypothetical protein V1809_10450 [Planctomycetota bacterium]
MTMEQRLENMERQLARMRRFNCWLLVAVGMVVGGWLALGVGDLRPSTAQAAEGDGKVEKVIRANKFVVEDENGKDRVMLGVIKGGPRLCLLDENSEPRAMLFINKVGSGLTLSDENDKERVRIIAIKDGSELLLVDENGKIRSALVAFKDRSALSLRDENGKTRAILNVGKDILSLGLLDEKGMPRASLNVVEQLVSSLELNDGVVHSSMQVNKLGPSMSLNCGDGKGSAFLSVYKETGRPTLDLAGKADSGLHRSIGLTERK